MESIENMNENERDKERIIIKRERDIQKQIVDMRIKEAKYNSRYKDIDLEIGKTRALVRELSKGKEYG